MALGSIDIACAEIIDGQQFAWVERTPLLQRLIGRTAGLLRAKLKERGIEATVRVCEPLALGPRTTVIPDLAVFTPGEAIPKLVVEYRSESTERYVLGPKRLIYARAGIPEMWFVEPHAAHVLTLAEHRGLDYVWPAREHRAGDAVASRIFPGVALRVADLID